MLVLSRKIGETIVIGNNIEIVVVAVEGDHVKIGVQAPREIEVYRKELYNAIQKSNQEAAKGNIQLHSLSQLIQEKES